MLFSGSCLDCDARYNCCKSIIGLEAFVVMVVSVGKRWSRRENDDRILVVVGALAADEWCN